MGPLVQASELSKALVEAGNNLSKPHSSTDATLTLLDGIESLLATVEQVPIPSVEKALIPSMKALVSDDLLRNPDSDVRVFVVSCLTEIMRITAPEAPYNDDQMKEIFKVTVEAFGKLADASSRSYKKAEVVLDTVSKVKASLVMLDLECDDLILEMFRQFVKIIRPDHPLLVLHSMEMIMITVIDESEEVPMDLVEILLTSVKKESQDVSPAAAMLLEKVLRTCARKLQPCIMEALKSTGTSLDMYSPVISSICQSESATTQAHNDVEAKKNEEKLNLELSRKGRSKRTAKGGAHLANGDDKVITGNDGQSQSTDGETASGSKRKQGRKPSSLMKLEEGYSSKTSTSKKGQEKELADSSLGKVAAKKASSRTKVAQTNQSVVISPPSSGRAKTGSSKRTRTKMGETNHDVDSLVTPPAKKQIVKNDNPEEEDLMESNLGKPEDGITTGSSSKKEKAQNGLAKTSAKKPLAETKMINPNGKKSVHSDPKKKNTEGASMDASVPRSSKSKKKDSRVLTPSTKKTEQTPKSHPKRKRTARVEVECNTNEFGEELVGKRVNVWWPLDNAFYEGVIKSYCSRKKTHQVSYSDGDKEELNLKNERFKIIEEIDEAIPLSEFIQTQKAKKCKNVSTLLKRTKGALKTVKNEPESTEGKNCESFKDLNDKPAGTKSRTGKKQKVARATHQESEKECDGKKEPETIVEESLKLGQESDAEPDTMEENQQLPENQNAETKTDGEKEEFAKDAGKDLDTGKEFNSLKEPNAEPKTDGEEQDAAKERTAETKTDGEENKVANETNAELETDEEEKESLEETHVEPTMEGEEQKSVKEPNAELETDEEEKESLEETHVEPTMEGEEQKSVKEPNAEPETKAEEKESAKEQTEGTKLIEKEDMSDAKGKEEIDKKSIPNMQKIGEAEKDNERLIKELKAESDKAEVSTTVSQVDP